MAFASGKSLPWNVNTVHFVRNLKNHIYRAMSQSGNTAQLVINMGLRGHYYFSVLERLLLFCSRDTVTFLF